MELIHKYYTEKDPSRIIYLYHFDKESQIGSNISTIFEKADIDEEPNQINIINYDNIFLKFVFNSDQTFRYFLHILKDTGHGESVYYDPPLNNLYELLDMVLKRDENVTAVMETRDKSEVPIRKWMKQRTRQGKIGKILNRN